MKAINIQSQMAIATFRLNKYIDIVHLSYNQIKHKQHTKQPLNAKEVEIYSRMLRAQKYVNQYQARYDDLLSLATKQQLLILQSA